MAQLSEHFSLAELTVTNKSIDNTPITEGLQSLRYTAQQMELVRTLLGKPIKITSAYRSPAVNKAVGGAASSQHLKGQAVDFTCTSFGTPRDIVLAIKASSIKYDQLICEYSSWVHISFKETDNRKQALIIDALGTREFK